MKLRSACRWRDKKGQQLLCRHKDDIVVSSSKTQDYTSALRDLSILFSQVTPALTSIVYLPISYYLFM